MWCSVYPNDVVIIKTKSKKKKPVLMTIPAVLLGNDVPPFRFVVCDSYDVYAYWVRPDNNTDDYSWVLERYNTAVFVVFNLGLVSPQFCHIQYSDMIEFVVPFGRDAGALGPMMARHMALVV